MERRGKNRLYDMSITPQELDSLRGRISSTLRTHVDSIGQQPSIEANSLTFSQDLRFGTENKHNAETLSNPPLEIPSFSLSIQRLTNPATMSNDEVYKYFKNESIGIGLGEGYLLGYKKKPSPHLLRGFIWEYLSYLYTKEILPESNILLSPKQTHEIFMSITTHKSRENTTIPDGILLGINSNLTFLFGVAEYKSVKQMPNRGTPQLERYSSGTVYEKLLEFLENSNNASYTKDYIASNYPTLPPFSNSKIPNPQFLFVGPEFRYYNNKQDVNRVNIDLPVSSEKLIQMSRNFTRYLKSVRGARGY